MSPGTAVKALTRTSPRTPCAAPTRATRMRSRSDAAIQATARSGGLGGLGGGCLGGSGALLRLLAGLRLVRIVARLALGEAGRVEEAEHTVRRLRADLQPVSDAVGVEEHPLLVALRQDRIVGADHLDEAA